MSDKRGLIEFPGGKIDNPIVEAAIAVAGVVFSIATLVFVWNKPNIKAAGVEISHKEQSGNK